MANIDDDSFAISAQKVAVPPCATCPPKWLALYRLDDRTAGTWARVSVNEIPVTYASREAALFAAERHARILIRQRAFKEGLKVPQVFERIDDENREWWTWPDAIEREVLGRGSVGAFAYRNRARKSHRPL